jgi:hypothetical protein
MLRHLLSSMFKRLLQSRLDRRKANHPPTLPYRPLLETLEDRTVLSTFTWLSPVSGDWDNPANWAGGQVPGVTGMAGVPDTRDADVVIPFHGITVTHAASSDRIIVSLINEASLDNAAGSLQLRGGTAFDGGDKPSRTDGPITVSGGTLTVGVGGRFGVALEGTGSVQNFGTLNLNARSTLDIVVDNEAGVLNDKGNITRAFINAPGAHLHFPGDVAFFDGANLPVIANGFTNQGLIDFTPDFFTSQEAGLVVPNGTVVNALGATIDFNAGGSIAANVDNQGAITVEGSAALGKSGAAITNEGTITVTPSLRLEGDFGVSDSVFVNTGTITVNSFRSFVAVVSQSSFTNTGTITVNGAASRFIVSGGAFNQGGTLSGAGSLGLNGITTTLTQNAISGVSAVSISGSTITSSDTLTSLSSIQNSTVNADVVNNRGGTNSLDIGGNSTVNGTLTNAAGATLNVTGNVTLGGNLTNAAGATLGVDGTLTIAQNFANDGAIRIGTLGDPNQALDPAVGSLTASQNVTNDGTIVLVNGDINVADGTLTNAPGGTISIGDGITDNGTGTHTLHAALVNQGTLNVKQEGDFTGDVTNSGTVNIQSGDLMVSPTDPASEDPTFSNTGTLTVDSLRALFIQGGFANSGTVSLTAFGSVVATGNFVQTGGTTHLSNGLVTANLVDLEGGILVGTGVMNANVRNNAEVDVGQPGSPGILTIVGAYNQTLRGVLVIEIGGATAGIDFGQLNITGQATLDGTLTVHLLNGFQPTSGASFVILTFSSGTGTFAAIDGDGPAFTPSYDPTDVTLVGN